MGPPQGRAEGQETLPRPAAHTLLNAPQDPTGLLGSQGTLLAHGQLVIVCGDLEKRNCGWRKLNKLRVQMVVCCGFFFFLKAFLNLWELQENKSVQSTHGEFTYPCCCPLWGRAQHPWPGRSPRALPCPQGALRTRPKSASIAHPENKKWACLRGTKTESRISQQHPRWAKHRGHLRGRRHQLTPNQMPVGQPRRRLAWPEGHR